MKVFWFHWFVEFLEQSNSEEKEVEWCCQGLRERERGNSCWTNIYFSIWNHKRVPEVVMMAGNEHECPCQKVWMADALYKHTQWKYISLWVKDSICLVFFLIILTTNWTKIREKFHVSGLIFTPRGWQTNDSEKVAWGGESEQTGWVLAQGVD